MNACIECMPCLGRNAVDIAKRLPCDDCVKHTVVADSLRLIAGENLDVPPPVIARKIIELSRKIAGPAAEDPYRAEKARSTELAKQLMTRIREEPGDILASFENRLRLAVAGNIIDYGIFGDLDLEFAMKAIRDCLSKPVDMSAVQALEKKMASAEHILYILDNCGEAVFDAAFTAPYKGKTTIGVRGLPAFNDVTPKELESSGFAGYSAIGNGSELPGTVLKYASREFREAFARADLIIAKGQGNFETLSDDHEHPVVFLFLAKCAVVCRHIGAEPYTIQVRFS